MFNKPYSKYLVDKYSIPDAQVFYKWVDAFVERNRKERFLYNRLSSQGKKAADEVKTKS